MQMNDFSQNNAGQLRSHEINISLCCCGGGVLDNMQQNRLEKKSFPNNKRFAFAAACLLLCHIVLDFWGRLRATYRASVVFLRDKPGRLWKKSVNGTSGSPLAGQARGLLGVFMNHITITVKTKAVSYVYSHTQRRVQ